MQMRSADEEEEEGCRVRRRMEEENRKVTAKLRREYNEQVRDDARGQQMTRTGPTVCYRIIQRRVISQLHAIGSVNLFRISQLRVIGSVNCI